MYEIRDLDIKRPQGHTLLVEGAGGSGHESGLPAGLEEHASDTGQDVLLAEMGRKTRG